MIAPGNDNLLFFADGALCGKLPPFLDDELNAVEAENFRCHLAGCARCVVGLQEALLLELLAERVFGGWTRGRRVGPCRGRGPGAGQAPRAVNGAGRPRPGRSRRGLRRGRTLD
jgi:Putative zinc-finger